MEKQSALIQIFGETPFTKVLDTLVDHPTYEYTKTELAEVNDISRSTLYRIWNRLEELEIVEPTRKVDPTQLYRLNHESRIAEKLVKFEEEVEIDSDSKQITEA